MVTKNEIGFVNTTTQMLSIKLASVTFISKYIKVQSPRIQPNDGIKEIVETKTPIIKIGINSAFTNANFVAMYIPIDITNISNAKFKVTIPIFYSLHVNLKISL